MDDSMVAPSKMLPRERPDPEPSRAALVTQWIDRVKGAKHHWRKDYERMRANMKFASGIQWPDQGPKDDRYMANLVQREIKTMVSSLYAKNPTVVMKRREKLDFQIWDGKPESLMMAMQQSQATGMVTPEAAMLLADIQQGTQRREMLDKIGKTMVILLNYYMDEQQPGFKLLMKQLIRRARTTGVGYVKLGFQRAMDLSEDQNATIKDMAERLAVIGRMQADIADGETDPNAAEVEKLRLAIAAIQNEPAVIVREGVTFNFPHSTRIIPSISTENLMGWVGSEWVAEEIMLTVDRIKEVYGVDIGTSYTSYKMTAGTPQSGTVTRNPNADSRDGLACVWHIYEKATGLQFVVCEGYPDFLQEPASPEVFIEQFFPWFAVTFNEVENEGELFPKSDVELLKHIQREYNRSKEALRQHRIANRPLYVTPKGSFEEEDIKSLSNYAAHAVIELNALKEGQKSIDLLQPIQKHGIDPNLYETEGLFNDMQRVTGLQEANIGGTGNSTATESNIAEQGRQGTIGLDGDDLDEMLTMLFRAAGQVCLTELDEATVKDIVGPGAVWPTLSRLEVMKEVWLETKAGSSGRPNQARDAATFERIYPLLLQVPGISPRWLAERAVKIADDDTDMADAIIDGLPSIMSQNRMMQQPTGDPATDPNSQGDKGGDNQEGPGKPGGTAQPGYPGSGAGGTAVQ